MIETKTFTGGLDLDSSLYRIGQNDYTYALNITKDAVEGSNDQVVTPIIANRIGDATYTLPSGSNKCIGAYPNVVRNTIIQFIWNINSYHSILEFNLSTRLQAKIFENLTDSGSIDILGFTENDKITSINVYNRAEGDLLFFIDSLGRPSGLDIDLFKAGTYTPVTRAIIDKAKKPPLSPPYVVYGNDTTRRSNNLRNKLFRFRYRWIYDDLEKSTFSPISIVPLPISILSDVYTGVITNNNVIRMVVNTGDKNVKAIEVGMSYVEKTNDWADLQSITTLFKKDLGLIQKTQYIAGTTNVDTAIITFSGAVITGTIINVYLTLLPNTQTLVGTYTVSGGDTLTGVASGIAASMITLGLVLTPWGYQNNLVFLWYNTIYGFGSIEIITTNADNDNIDYPYGFYNDSTYPTIPIEESIQLFDYIPLKANAQELLNGDTLAYIGLTEGYDKDTAESSVITVNTIAASGTGGGGTFVAVKTLVSSNNPTKQGVKYAFSGIPATGTVIEVKVKRASDHVVLTASTYTTVAGDTIYTVEAALAANNTLAPSNTIAFGFGSIFVATSMITYEPIVTTFYSDLIITPPTSATTSNSIPTFPWSETINIARGYFDSKGVTNGIFYTDKVTFPAYAENGSSEPLLPYINYKINDIPPIWAYSLQFYLTKTATTYIAWVTKSVNKNEIAYIYLDVTNFTINAVKKPTTATVLSYTFKDGDRMRFWRETLPSLVVFPDTYDSAIEGVVVDPIINLVPTTGTFLKIKNIEPFTTNISSSKNYVILIYSPVQQSANVDNQVYYEFGQQYAIINPTLDSRVHSGLVQNQVIGLQPAEFNFYEGDAYFRQRTIAIAEGDLGYAIYNALDRNFVDNYVSAVNSVDGRPSIIDNNARQAYYSTLIRHSQSYQANTNINGLNRFYSKNFDEYDYSFGDAIRLKVRDRLMRVYQKNKTGVVTLFSSIGKDANGTTVIFQTDKLLNPIQYYVGNFGIGDCAESLTSFNYADYFCDNIRGAICRVSNDGVIPISILYKTNSWSNDNLPLRKGVYKTYGAFDQRLFNYIIALEAVECIGVTAGDFTLNDVVAETAYSQVVTLSGSLNFTLENIVKPAWLTITISGYQLLFSGTPSLSDIGVDAPVTFDVVNECGIVSEDKTITVTTPPTPPCIAVAIVGAPVLPNGAVDTPYSYSFDLTGTEPFTLTGVTKPSWMTITVSGSSIVFSGTPDSTGTAIPVIFTINNCSGDTAAFSETFDITGENWFIYYSNNLSSIPLTVYVGNNATLPSALIYTGNYTSNPLSGTDNTNLPLVNANVVLTMLGKTIVSATCNGTLASFLGGSSVSWSGITGGPLTIIFRTA